jgi:dTDP-4-dehydrorhamnose 3,5-epimerase
MIFTETRLKGVFEIALDVRADERGFFARSYCAAEFAAHGLNPRVVQCNISHNAQRGTVRGMHYQEAPHGEAKLIRCVRGALYDVVIDLRADSPTFHEWVGVELRADDRQPSPMLFVPEGFAHGFQTLADDTEIFYQMSEFYVPEAARGYRWDDPAFSLTWPEPVRVISERDRTYPDCIGAPSQGMAR